MNRIDLPGSTSYPIPRRAGDAKLTEDGPRAVARTLGTSVRRHWGKLLAWIAAGVLFAALYAFTTPPTYTATAAVLLEPRSGLTSPTQEWAASSFDLVRADSELQVLRSERLLRQVFDNLRLVEHPEFQSEPVGPITRTLAGLGLIGSDTSDKVQRVVTPEPPAEVNTASSAATSERTRRLAFAAFSQQLTVRRIGQSYVIEIAFTAADPALAPRVANAAVSAYLLQSLSSKADAALISAIVQSRINALTAQVTAAAAAVIAGTLPDSPTPDADARVIGAAVEPLEPSAPRKKLIVTFGAAAAFFSGLLTMLFRDALDQRIRTAEELTQCTGLTCLATVPEVGRWRGLWRLSDSRLHALALRKPTGTFAAAVSELRTAIRLYCPVERGAENLVVAFVAPTPQTGCTLLCANLARLTHMSGKPVALISDDIRGTGRGLQAPKQRLLPEGLAPKAEIDKGVFVDVDGVALLEARPRTTLGALLIDLGGNAMQRVVADARERGDVLIDAPSMRSPALAQAAVAYSDAVVLIVAAGRTTADDAAAAVRALQGAGARVIGAVLNRLPE